MTTATAPMTMTTATAAMTRPMTLDQVAARAGVCRQTIMAWVRRGRFVKPLDWGLRARVWLWDPAAVEAFLAGSRGKVT
jgi:hypothetical protein